MPRSMLIPGVWLMFLVCKAAAQTQYDCTKESFARFMSHFNGSSSSIQSIEDALNQKLCQNELDLTADGRASVACDLLQLLAIDVPGSGGVLPYLSSGMPEYTNRTEVNWSDNCWQTPACIVSSRTSEEVSQMLRIVTFIGSKFAVRSGGHNPNTGFGSIGPDGVLVDMVNINYTTLSEDHQTISIGAGQRLGPAYAAADKLGYYFSGGKDPNPAVGGYFLGGGITFFASEYGMGSNGIKNVEMVLANSSIVQANAKENPDLFWAIKGGGPNYGIITRYDVEALPVPRVWYEYRIYNPSELQDLLVAMVEYQKAAENDSDASIVFQSFPNQTLMGYIHKGGKAWPRIFKSFQNVPYNTTLVNSTLGTPSQLVYSTEGAETEARLKYSGMSVAIQPDIDIYKEAYATFLNVAASTGREFSGELAFGIQPFPLTAVKQSKRNGGTPLNLTSTSQTWLISQVQWTDDADNDAALDAVEQVGTAANEAAAKRGLALPFKFMNDANYKQNVLQSYGSQSLARLKAIARNADPTGVFQNLQNDGFLLRKS